MKYLHHQQKHLFGLMAIVFLCSCASENHANEPEASISPPQLVSCASEATCDRDPEHLKEFLVSFYNWYNKSEDDLTNLRPPQFETEQPKFQKMLEPYFEPETFGKLFPPINPTSDDPDVIDDPILCSNDLFPVDDTVIDVQEVAMRSTFATFNVRFIFDGLGPPRKPLPIDLKVSSGAWKIFRIGCK